MFEESTSVSPAPVNQTLATTYTTCDRSFIPRHIAPDSREINAMLEVLGYDSLEELVDRAIPTAIRLKTPLNLPPARSEHQALQDIKQIASQNKIYKNYIGMGYTPCITPPVILRNILENPAWYTAYTPYQAEIAQGRLEALLNFQTLIIELTGLDIANASLLDEGTACAEAMTMSYSLCKTKATHFFISEQCHPQTLEVIKTRANPLGIKLIIGDHRTFDFSTPIFGALLQYPTTDGIIHDYRSFINTAHNHQALVTLACDLLSLALLTPPAELGADIAVGNSQRFGVPMGLGGPHAGYFATKEAYKRQIPGRIVGISKDSHGKPALRLALQTREQHIRREKATSNICTAQVLLAVMASMYAVYHGQEGIKTIANRVHYLTGILAEGLQKLGYNLTSQQFFDTLSIQVGSAGTILKKAYQREINLRRINHNTLGITLDETTTEADIIKLWEIFSHSPTLPFSYEEIIPLKHIPDSLKRTSPFLTDPVFNSYHSEHELLRYLYQLQSKDLSLTTSMIPLGSCTMKLNATAEMIPITWTEFSDLHPYAPLNQIQGYQMLFEQLETWLAEITGFAGISLQPNAGSQGEYAGLQVIRQYHIQRGEGHRNICLIPESAHGTNPASAIMCGMKVIGVKCDENGNIDVQDLTQKADKYQQELSVLMITYPSTHGVFEETIIEICDIIHQRGGQVYLDGANMNAQVGLCRPGDFGADVCHLNLHKTFCIPHGGGGPGMGPIGVGKHLIPYLPMTQLGLNEDENQDNSSIGMISSAPWGSASILPISWMYIAMMGGEGLTQATKIAILNANYMAHRLNAAYPVLFKGESGLVAHECIVDLRLVKKSAGIEVDDIAKRLMDYGFHAPTVSWPVAGTMMIEPTESETKDELDRFCDSMLQIRQEIAMIESGSIDSHNNPLKNAPHTAESLICGEWNHPYSRETAAYPTPRLKQHKFWVSVGRIDNAYGDRNLVCSCQVSMDDF